MAKKKGLWANIHAKRKRGEKPAKPGEEGYPKTLDIEKYKKGGKTAKDFKPHMMYKDGKAVKADTYKKHLSLNKQGYGHTKKEMGGPIKGASHDNGGVVIEAEGGEYVIRKDSVNPQTEAVLEYINEYGKLPVRDARKRGKK